MELSCAFLIRISERPTNQLFMYELVNKVSKLSHFFRVACMYSNFVMNNVHIQAERKKIDISIVFLTVFHHYLNLNLFSFWKLKDSLMGFH